MTLYDLFDEYVYNYHYAHNSKNEVLSNISHYKTYFKNNKNIEDITQDDIQNFVNYEYYANCYENTTIFNRFSRLKAIFNYAIRKKYILVNPCSNISVSKVNRVHKELDCSKKFVRQLLKIFKKTKLYMYVYLDLHTRT